MDIHSIRLKSRINGFLPPPAPSPVMPVKAPRCAPCGIHDFSVSVIKALDPGAARKSWMPAFAGMTGIFGGNSHIFASLASLLRALSLVSQLLGVELQNSAKNPVLMAGQP